MGREKLISDFDGVWTDPQQEAIPFIDAYIEKLSRAIGFAKFELSGLVDDSRETIMQSPGVFGWEYNGIIVAPATADPYLFIQAAVRLTLSRLSEEKVRNIPIGKDLSRLLDRLFAECYPLTDTVFNGGQENAREFLALLHNESDLTIVTNSQTTNVMRKLAILFGRENHGIRVVGNAKKYAVNNRGNWGIDKTMTLPGLLRPVYLRRFLYNRVVNEINPSKVFGDIFELDLALPEAKEIQTILVTSSNTPEWDFKHYIDNRNGSSVNNLSDLATIALEK